MNIRKNVDYSEMYEALDNLMERQLPQMELCREIGKIVCQRPEKGAAVMASEYLNKYCPDARGFSPRSLRRMRDFYRTYEKHPVLLSRAMQIGWMQNVVIMEAELTMEQREWYMKAAKQFDWSKTELIANIATNAHENYDRIIEDRACCNVEQNVKQTESNRKSTVDSINRIRWVIQRIREWWVLWQEDRRRCSTRACEKPMEKSTNLMRC